MKISLSILFTLAFSALAQDLLFLSGLQEKEYDEAVALGISIKTVTEAEWSSMTTADFAKYKALIISDPSSPDVSRVKFLEDSMDAWSPAITGNIILIGTDPSNHFSTGGAKTLIDNSITFAAAGVTPAGVPQTGLYFALSQYYAYEESSTVKALSYFGNFTTRGNLDCYNKAHLVSSSPVMTLLDDVSLSDWSCSVHEAFVSYPSVGTNGFQALAIAEGIVGVGSQTFGDGTLGLPYIISRGATPAKCGDGVWDEEFGEECDDHNLLNGDGCSLACKCESGRPRGDGTCFPSNTTTSTGPTGTGTGYTYPPTSYPSASGSYGSTPPSSNSSVTSYPSASGSYGSTLSSGNSSVTSIYSYPSSYPSYTPPPYVTPSCSMGPNIIGVEVIIVVTCSSTYIKERPIYDISVSALPCYACAMSSDNIGYTSTDFITVTTTSYEDTMPTCMPAPVLYACDTCEAHTLTETNCVTESGDAHTERPALPTPRAHSFESEVEEYYTAPASTKSEYRPGHLMGPGLRRRRQV